jgi:nitrite reductase (NADH) small subunit
MQSTTDVRWIPVARTEDFPADGGACVKVGNEQIAVFNFATLGKWFACQNMCPHKGDMVLSRGLIGDHAGVPKVACPMHKKTFCLESGRNLNGEDYQLTTYPVRVVEDEVYIGIMKEATA